MHDEQPKKERSWSQEKDWIVFALLGLLILAIYANTFNASWQFDDKPNILQNTKLHLTDLSPASLWDTFFAKAGKDIFFRPLPSLSLALNWYIGQDNTFGFHLVNITIHLLNAFLLFLASRNLLQTPKLKKRFTPEEANYISLLGTVLWAVNPIQIQAVTYIVQRMASMAALFYICGLYFYVKGRLAESGKMQVWLFTACFVGFVFALMSKENTVVFPFSLIIIDLLFFQDVDVYKQVRARLPVLITLSGLVILSGIVLFKAGALDFLFSGYESRPFTLMERMLTPPRILLYYISQIFYPLPSRLSITHDIIVSTSLFSPWTTLPALIMVLSLVGMGLFLMKNRPLVSFAILFFFLNHLIESTLLPLELLFEHRNYLPSFSLFLPVGALLISALNMYRANNRFMYAVIASFITFTIIGLGCFTYVRNQDWRTEASLWRDAMQKAPRDARPLVNLAIQLAWSPHPTSLQYEAALDMLHKAMTLNTARDFLVSDIINNIGSIHYHQGAYQKAADIYRQGLEIDPGFLKMRYDLINVLVMQGRWEVASIEADRLIGNPKNFIRPEYYTLKGFILLWQGHAEEALVYFRKSLEMKPGDLAALLNAGVAFSLMGDHERAALALQNVAENTRGDIRPFFALIENSARAKDWGRAETHAQKTMQIFGVQAVLEGLDTLSENHRTAPMSAEIIMPVLKKTMLRTVEDLQLSLSAIPAKCDLSEK